MILVGTTALPDLSFSSSLYHLKITNIASIQAGSLACLLSTCVAGTLKKLNLELLDLDAEMPLPPPCSALTPTVSITNLKDMPVQEGQSLWSSLDVLLSSSHFSGLERVIFSAETPLFGSTVDALTQCLPLLHSRRERINQS
jgi:hypothetical protein